MSNAKTFNVYCDESCHIENDNISVMAWGAVICENRFTRDLSQQIRRLKTKHGLKSNFEAKWVKVSPAKADFYLELVDLFITDSRLSFRGIVVPEKHKLDHAAFDQSHDEWYHKMYFLMLRHIFTRPNRYRIYLDIKDTQGGPKIRKLHEILANNLGDFQREHVERVEQLRSHESELLQVADLLIGALTYANRGLSSSSAKRAIIDRLCDRFGEQVLCTTSSSTASKFNILLWQGRKPPK